MSVIDIAPASGGSIIVPDHYRQDCLDVIVLGTIEGTALKTLCRRKNMPPHSTVRRWLATNEEFRNRYLDAYKVHVTLAIPDILTIADDDSEKPARSRLRVDARFKLLEKLDPDRFGKRKDKTDDMTGLLTFIAGRQSVAG